MLVRILYNTTKIEVYLMFFTEMKHNRTFLLVIFTFEGIIIIRYNSIHLL